MLQHDGLLFDYDIDKMIHQQLPGSLFLLDYNKTKDMVLRHKNKLTIKSNLKLLDRKI